MQQRAFYIGTILAIMGPFPMCLKRSEKDAVELVTFLEKDELHRYGSDKFHTAIRNQVAPHLMQALPELLAVAEENFSPLRDMFGQTFGNDQSQVVRDFLTPLTEQYGELILVPPYPEPS